MTDNLTPYDTGTRLEPQVWVHRPDPADDALDRNLEAYGKVDFDDNEGRTIVTLHVESNPSGGPDTVNHVLVLDGLNEPIVVLDAAGRSFGILRPADHEPPRPGEPGMRGRGAADFPRRPSIWTLSELVQELDTLAARPSTYPAWHLRSTMNRAADALRELGGIR